MKLLIVEDTEKLAQSLTRRFALDGHGTDNVTSLADAEEIIAVTHYDIMLLDIMLPDGDGRRFLRQLRLQGNALPVIVMTARSAVSEKVDLLDIGADDYIIKPFEFAELEARCRAVLRRNIGHTQTNLAFADIALNPLTAELVSGEGRSILRNRELRLLEIFINSPEIIFTKEQLTDRLFSLSETIAENTIEVYVSRIRKKLSGCRAHIETMRGIGYRLTRR